MGRRRCLGVLLAALLAGVPALPASGSGAAVASAPAEVRAGSGMGEEFRISGEVARNASFLAMAYNGAHNEYLVVWEDMREGWGIYGRRVAADGAPIGTDFRIDGGDGGSFQFRLAPAVAWNAAADEYLVVWPAMAQGVSSWDLQGRRVAASGWPIGVEFRVNSGGGGSDEWTPAVVWNGTANEYLVVWEDWREASTRLADIYARRVSAGGAPIGSDIRVSGQGGTGNEMAAAVAWNESANQYLVVWEDGRRKATRGSDVWGRRLAGDGRPVGTDFRVSSGPAPADVLHPQVAWNGARNEYLVVWEDWRNAATSGSDIYGRRLRADGSFAAPDFRVSGADAGVEETRPAVAWGAAANRYLVAWEDRRLLYGGVERGIYGRWVGAAGSPLGSAVRVSGDLVYSWYRLPTVAGTAEGGYLAVWADDRTGQWQVYGRPLPASAPRSVPGAQAVEPPGDRRAYPYVAPTSNPTADLVMPASPEAAGTPVERVAGQPITVDVGIVYTRAARLQAGGRAAIEAWVANGVMYTNEALARSEVDVRLRVVFIEEIEYHAFSGCVGNVLWLATGASVFAPARALRDARGADLLSLITEDGQTAGNALGPYAEFVLRRRGSSRLESLYFAFDFAHEWGHDFGAGHEQGNPASPCSPPGCGYDAPDSSFSDIMSYGLKCELSQQCPHIPNYSNPDVTFSWLDPPVLWGGGNAYDNSGIASDMAQRQGSAAPQPTGVEGQADNAGVMNGNAPQVAGWRPTVVPDSATCSGFPATWLGTDGPDVFRGTPRRDVVVAGGGDDVVYGSGGSDIVCAGTGNDRVYGGADTDFLFGGPGNDDLYGEAGDDFLAGEAGRDGMQGGDGNDVLSGGAGADRLEGGNGADYLYAGAGNDALLGGEGFDRLLGRQGNDRLRGGNVGDTYFVDHLQPGPGADTVEGATAILDFEDTNGPVRLTLSGAQWPISTTGANGTATVRLNGVSLLSLVGSRFDDSITVRDQNVCVFGLAGDDTLSATDDITQGCFLLYPCASGWCETRARLFGDDGDDSLDGGSVLGVHGGDGTDRCRGSTVAACEGPL